MVADKFSSKTGIPWIANWNDPARSIWPQPYTERMSFLSKLIHSLYAGRMIKHASINTFPSVELRDHFASFFSTLNGGNAEIIPHIGILSPPSKNSKPRGPFRMCHSGNLSIERNPSSFFRAVAKLIDTRPNIQISIDLMGSCNEYVTALIHDYHLEQWVKYIGAFPFMKCLEQMSSYDVLLLIEADARPCVFLPSKLADYAQLGIPILAISPSGSCVSNIIEQFGGGCTVDCNDEDKILMGLDSLYTSWKHGSLRNEFNSERLNAYFSPQRITSIYKELFLSLNDKF
jgi:glycosyltransferase involved in cell wall biosynthesis